MDEQTRLYGEITKLNFLMELLWAEELFSHGADPNDVGEAAERALAKWELPDPDAAGEEFHEYVAHRLVSFFARVQVRVEQKSLE